MNKDEQAIYDIIKQLEQAWNTGNGDAFAAHFCEDAAFTVWNGMFQQGKAAIAAGHNHILSTFYKGTKNRYEIGWLRFVRPDVAVMQLNAGFVEDPNGALAHTPMRDEWPMAKPLMVMSKQDDRWRVEVFQNTPVIERA